MPPFRQGDLDGLCGIYSLINALKLLYPNLSHRDSGYLLFEIFEQFHISKSKVDFIIDGLTPRDIGRGLKHTICSQYDVVYTKPFHKKPRISLDELWTSMAEFLDSTEPRAIIIAFGNDKYSHYTAVRSITRSRLIVYDSDSRKVLNRRQLSTNEVIKKASLYIYPTSAFYMHRL